MPPSDDAQPASSSHGQSAKPQSMDVAAFRFLDLPPELRNRTYRMVLVKPTGERTKWEGEDRRQPALLRTSRQVRSDTLSIYYSENYFSIDIRDMKGAVQILLRKLVLKYRAKGVQRNLRISVRGVPSWVTLLGWIEAYYADPMLVAHARFCDGCSKGTKVMAAAFEICKQSAAQPWTEVEGLLEQFHKGIAALDTAWT